MCTSVCVDIYIYMNIVQYLKCSCYCRWIFKYSLKCYYCSVLPNLLFLKSFDVFFCNMRNTYTCVIQYAWYAYCIIDFPFLRVVCHLVMVCAYYWARSLSHCPSLASKYLYGLYESSSFSAAWRLLGLANDTRQLF